jgi:hypothetical protein
MPHSTRILLCRLGLVLFCLLPTAAVSGWIGLRAVTGSIAAQSPERPREGGDQLRLLVEIEDVHYPRPNVARLAGVRVLDPHSGEVVATAAEVEVVPTADGWSLSATGNGLAK